MKINRSNYYQQVNQVGVEHLSPGIKKMHEVIDKVTSGGSNWDSYQLYKDRFEKQFEALELFVEQSKSQESPKETEQEAAPKKETKQYNTPKRHHKESKHRPPSGGDGGSNKKKEKSHKKPKQPKVKRFEKPKVKGRGVELISPEVTFIRRFALLQGKTKQKDQVRSFIAGLQKAIAERRIRKTSKQAKVINEIQKYLLNKFNEMERKDLKEHTFDFNEKDFYRYYKIAGAEYLMPSVRIIKAYYNMQGKDSMTLQKASNLLNRLIRAIEKKEIGSADKYYKQVKLIKDSLQEYLDMRGERTPRISEAQLNGLAGILKSCGCEDVKGFEYEEVQDNQELNGIMTVEQAKNRKYKLVPLTGEYLEIIGPMELPTHFLVYGLGGGGKTSWTLRFTQHLAAIGYKILYIAKEQFDTPQFKKLLITLNIQAGENFQIVRDIGILDPRDFDFVVLDTKDDMDVEVKQFQELKRKYPDQSFIIIPHGTKTGNFIGSGKWRNIVDVLVQVDNGIAKTGNGLKNRWGGRGEMKVY